MVGVADATDADKECVAYHVGVRNEESLRVDTLPAAATPKTSDYFCFFFSSRRRHTRFDCDWSSDVCSSDLAAATAHRHHERFYVRPHLQYFKSGSGDACYEQRLVTGMYVSIVILRSQRLAMRKIGRASCRERV